MDHSTPDLEFSIGIPVWNEELVLAENSDRLREHLVPYGRCEIIIVSNGSTDNTVAIGRDLAVQNPQVRFFELPARDVAGAFKLMLQEARSNYLITLDMDLSADLGFVEHALALLPSHDLVIGSKKLGTQNRSWIRRIGSDLYIRCANRLLQFGVDDYSMGAKGYRVSFFRQHSHRLEHGTGYVVDCIYFARYGGGRIIEIPISCNDLRSSRFNLIHEAVHKFVRLGKIWLRHRQGAPAAGKNE